MIGDITRDKFTRMNSTWWRVHVLTSPIIFLGRVKRPPGTYQQVSAQGSGSAVGHGGREFDAIPFFPLVFLSVQSSQ